MPIVEKKLPGNRWERTYTGADIPAAKGELAKWGAESYQKAFNKNKGIGFEQITDPSGNPTWLRSDQVAEARQQGYGVAAVRQTWAVPEMPWKQKRVGPGKHRFKFDKATGEMAEVM